MRDFKGQNYNSALDAADIAKKIKQAILKDYPAKYGFKFSVTIDRYSMGQSIDVSIKEVPANVKIYDYDNYKAAQGDPDLHEWKINKGFRAFKERIEKIRNSYNFDRSEPETDYFNVNYYGSTAVHYDLSTAKQELIKLIFDKDQETSEAAQDFEEDTTSNYNQRIEAKKGRFEDLAVKNREESETRYKTVTQLSNLMNGQPILIGHHSEKRHRRDIEKMDNNMRKSIEADKKAEYYTDKAANYKSNGISGDDPQAIEKLKIKVAKLEELQQLMKDCNKLVKSKAMADFAKIDGMVKLGLSEDKARKLLEPDFCGRYGFASYALTNNGANIRRVNQRIKSLLVQSTKETTSEEAAPGVQIVENTEANRLQVKFDGIPPEEVRTDLKKSGFRWSRYNMAWQRHLSNGAKWDAETIVKNHYQ